MRTGRLAAECEVVWMKISTSNAEAMVLFWNTIDCSLGVWADWGCSSSNAGVVLVRRGEEGAEPVGLAEKEGWMESDKDPHQERG